jgi:hypothetical protein
MRMLVAVVVSFAAAFVVVLAQTPAVQEDCISYTASTIEINDRGARGWVLERADGAILALLDNKTDAEAALAVAKRHSALCYIGRDNRRPNHRDYVMTYWK